MKQQNTYRRVRGTGGEPFLPGLAEEGDVVDVSSFSTSPVKFISEGNEPTDDFFVAQGSWKRLGAPDRILVTVEAA